MGATALVVDDSPSIRAIVRVFLTGRDLEIVEAEGAERALQVLKLLPVSLVIADINMPQVDGLTFVKQLRAHERAELRNLPVLLLSGDKSADIEVRAIEAGATAYLKKPVNGPTLQAAVDRLLGSGK